MKGIIFILVFSCYMIRHIGTEDLEMPLNLRYHSKLKKAGRAGSDGSTSASGSAGPGSIPGEVVNFHLKFSTSGLGGVEMYTF